MSSLSWLDYSEHDRRRMLDVIDLFKEKDTRDELGLAGVRDAFADRFFPGTSTIMTRARYFLLVPWTYLRLEQRRVTSNRIAAAARQAEVDLIEVIERLIGICLFKDFYRGVGPAGFEGGAKFKLNQNKSLEDQETVIKILFESESTFDRGIARIMSGNLDEVGDQN